MPDRRIDVKKLKESDIYKQKLTHFYSPTVYGGIYRYEIKWSDERFNKTFDLFLEGDYWDGDFEELAEYSGLYPTLQDAVDSLTYQED